MNNMHGVGHHLQVTAWKKTPQDPDRDAYARSAFNRYYYGVFLTVRDMFRKMGLHWEEMRHASYPEALSGQLQKISVRLRRIGTEKLMTMSLSKKFIKLNRP